MKVLFVITKADEIGGAQIHVRDLAVELHKNGHSVEVIVGENGELVRQLNENAIKVHVLSSLTRNVNPVKDISSVFSLRRLIKKIAPDIITLHSSKAGVVGRLAAIGLNIPVLFTVHGWAFADGVPKFKKTFYILIEKILSPLADHFITVSEQDKKLAESYHVVNKDKQTVVHNCIPGHIESESTLSSELKMGGTIEFISVARFSKQKDHATLLKAFKNISYPDWNLSLVGKGALLDDTKALALSLGIADKVKFLGERNDVDSLLSNSNVFILISRWEGFPISILEAMKHGLPVIASDVGGVAEAVYNGMTGFLVDRENSEQLTDVIDKLCNNPELRIKLGKAGYLAFKDNFTLEKMYEKTLAVYSNEIDRKRRD